MAKTLTPLTALALWGAAPSSKKIDGGPAGKFDNLTQICSVVVKAPNAKAPGKFYIILLARAALLQDGLHNLLVAR